MKTPQVMFLVILVLSVTGYTVASALPAQPVSFDCSSVSEIPQTECQALVALYHSTGGLTWLNNGYWLFTDTPCSWYGVKCLVGRVTEIRLSDNRLGGVIPPELGGMTHLEYLDLTPTRWGATSHLHSATWLTCNISCWATIN